MASAAQITANQANAQLSTGPRSEAGKQTSSKNATTTGLTSAKIFVRPGEEAAFEEFEEEMAAELNPVGTTQFDLYTVIVHAAWNIRRTIELENEIQNEAISKGISDALLDDELSRKLDRIYRYKKMHESSHRRAMAQLRQIQTEHIWRRENDELKDESVLVDTLKVMTTLRANLKEAGRQFDRELNQQMAAYLNAPIPGYETNRIPPSDIK